MPSELLPLFPLGVVLFPRTAVPLHIFEERYKEMIGESVADSSEFGIVLARENGVLNEGCAARVERVLKKYEDGRMDIVAVGTRRFQLQRLNDERNFLRGEVSFFDDAAGTSESPGLRQKVTRGFQAMFAEQVREFPFEIDFEDPQVSFQMGQLLPEVGIKQQLLSMRSENERLSRLMEVFPAFAAQRRITEQIKQVAPRNGHRHLPGGIEEA